MSHLFVKRVLVVLSFHPDGFFFHNTSEISLEKNCYFKMRSSFHNKLDLLTNKRVTYSC